MSIGKAVAAAILVITAWHYLGAAQANRDASADVPVAAAQSHDAYPDFATAAGRSVAHTEVAQNACTAAALGSPMTVHVRNGQDAQIVNGWAAQCGYPRAVAVIEPDTSRLDIVVD